jgi:hypothetical protein
MKNMTWVAVLFIVAGCSPQIQVYSDSDPDYKVSNYSTFRWAQHANIEANKNPLFYNELNDKRIKAAVTYEMTSRGFNLSDSSSDLIIHYHIIIDDQSVVTTEPYGYFYGPYWLRTETKIYSYRKGMLIIDLMDRTTSNLVWRGWATTEIDSVVPEQASDIINRAVAKIFKKFPDSAPKPQAVLSRKIDQ